MWGANGLAYNLTFSAPPTVETYHADQIGSIREITNADGSVRTTYLTDEYGNRTSVRGADDQPFQFTGEQVDPESGFVYLRARYYDPGIGRFITRDTWPGTAGVPESLSRYGFAGNNPINYGDPSGHCLGPLALICVGAVLGGGAYTVTHLQDWDVGEFLKWGTVGATARGIALVAIAAAPELAALGAGATLIPLGFENSEQFEEFGSRLSAGLETLGITDARGIVQGSAVTGRSFRTEAEFDIGRVSDIDLGIISPQLMERARAAGVALRSGGTRTGPNPLPELDALRAELSALLGGRPVNIMIFQDEQAASRAAGIDVP